MSCLNPFTRSTQDQIFLEALQNKPLAFSSASTLVSATSRLPFVTSDKTATLNVECFFFEEGNRDVEKSKQIPNANKKKHVPVPIILYVHGVCSSAETLGVQHLVAHAKKKRYRVAVLELEGHGLSSGARGVCSNFKRLVGHVTEFVKHVLTTISKHSNALSNKNEITGINDKILETDAIPFVLCGNSLGGILAAYAADIISKSSIQYPGRLIGVSLIAPAVGVDPKAIPSPIALGGLKLLSLLAPSASISLTPMEDPISYAAPKNSTRNYHGYWPLGTSRMLLDVTTQLVKNDLKNNSISMNKVKSLILFSGEDDEIVPYNSVKEFFESIKAREKALIAVPGAGHDLLYHPEYAKEIINQMFQWIELRLWATGQAKSK